MRTVEVGILSPGDILARDVVSERGDVLLRKGTELTERYIKALTTEEISVVSIEDALIDSQELDHEELISDKTRLGFVNAYYALSKRLKFSEDYVKDVYALDKAVNDVIDDIRSLRTTMVTNVGDYVGEIKYYVHPLHVMIYSIIMGLRLGYNDFEIKDLAMGAALHDIGKVYTDGIDHTEEGFKIVKNFSVVRGHVALQHHEYFDGTGKPKGVKSINIHELARIVSIANEFDNLTFILEGKDRMPVYLAVEKIQSLSGTQLDPLLVKTFVTQIALYPVGSFVRLNNGYYGVVASYVSSVSSRPTVIMVGDKKGKKLEEYEKVDLMADRTLFVTEVIPEVDRIALGLV